MNACQTCIYFPFLWFWNVSSRNVSFFRRSCCPITITFPTYHSRSNRNCPKELKPLRYITAPGNSRVIAWIYKWSWDLVRSDWSWKVMRKVSRDVLAKCTWLSKSWKVRFETSFFIAANHRDFKGALSRGSKHFPWNLWYNIYSQATFWDGFLAKMAAYFRESEGTIRKC